MLKRKATIVVDLGFGDAGKGTVVDFLARQSLTAAVVRFNGGGQAAHNVVTPEGRHHTFSQFGSGTFVPGVRTHLSRFMLVDPLTLANEEAHLRTIGCANAYARLSVDEDARVVTPFHKAGNRLREVLRGTGQHGTCGMGIGEVMADHLLCPTNTIYAHHLHDKFTLVGKLRHIQEEKYSILKDTIASVSRMPRAGGLMEEMELLYNPRAVEDIADRMVHVAKNFQIVSGAFLEHLSKMGQIIFEGAQGVLLDEWYGFHPHTTWSTTTFKNASTLLEEIGCREQVERLGVLRAYFTRHGAGPFPTEDPRLSLEIPDRHNGAEGWQGKFRVGWFDLVLARYAMAVCGKVDALAITNLDRFSRVVGRKIATSYDVGSDTPVSRLSVKTSLEDLYTQEELGKYLRRVVPIYQAVPDTSTEEQYLHMIESNLTVPITITSRGPTAVDKCFRAHIDALA